MSPGVAEEGDPVSQNGFSDKTAMKYAHGVAVSAKFGLNDDLIKESHPEVLEGG